MDWYFRNRRDLPWRRNRHPYQIWISEIMLQQTRVAVVIRHYHKFLVRFPTVHRLAAARESSVLAVWSGLGYYRRARMLHAASKQIVKQFAGKFPEAPDELAGLPGIGRYTAAAIASIAHDRPVAVVDGNVKRVLARMIGRPVSERQVWQTASRLLSHQHPGDFNQALMELGAVICLPQGPKCDLCPVIKHCSTRGVLPRSNASVPQKKRTVCYSLDRRDGSILLVKRPDRARLMPGMWELPEIKGSGKGPAAFTVRHSITVTRYVVRVIMGSALVETSGTWVKNSRLRTLPLTGLARKILSAAEII
ncbi:MAG: A/G-specific adenine glycosylase [Terriglobales bacterium]